MKIGILTFHFSDNYGALLQAYALRSWLLQNGHEADFVNYHPDYVEAGGSLSLSPSFSILKANAKIIYLKGSSIFQKLLGSKEAAHAMESFRLEYLGVIGDPIKNRNDFKSSRPKYDLLICGSDQIWNPSQQFGVDPVYFLDFPADVRRRISYAASFGGSSIDKKYHAEVSLLLKKLDSVAVREENAVEFVTDLIGEKPTCVPDPTILLDNYSDIISKVKSTVCNEQIFTYILRSGKGFSAITEALATEHGIKVFSAHNPHRRWTDVGEKIHGGVSEWLGNLEASKMVVTNSFHATVFSILLNRPFIAVRLPGARSKLSGRLESLLEKTGLSDRLINAGDVKSAIKVSNTPVNWSKVNQAVAELRKIGRDYLAEEIAKVV